MRSLLLGLALLGGAGAVSPQAATVQSGMLGRTATRQSVKASPFCKAYHCTDPRKEAVDRGPNAPRGTGLLFSVSAPAGVLALESNVAPDLPDLAPFNSVHLKVRVVSTSSLPTPTPALIAAGQAFYSLALGKSSEMTRGDVQGCLRCLFTDLKARPQGSAMNLGRGRTPARQFSCDAVPVPGHAGSYDLQFSADVL